MLENVGKTENMKHEKNVEVKSDSNRTAHGRQFRARVLCKLNSISIKLDLELSVSL
jgi:hypothetical protein